MSRLTVTIEQINSSGAGVARHEGKVYFVPFAVPGDVVEIMVVREHKRYAECRILRIISKSPHRVEPPCPYYFKCGGCQLQHVTYDEQLKAKQNQVINALSRLGKFQNVSVAPTRPSPEIFNYRNRIRLHRDKAGRVGFFSAGSHKLIEIEKCLIAREELNIRIKAIKDGGENFPPDGELRADGAKAFGQVNPEQNENLVRQVIDFAVLTGNEEVVDLYAGSGNFSFPLAQKAKKVWAIERDAAAVEWGKKKSASGRSPIIWINASALKGLLDLKREGACPSVIVCDPPRQGMKEALDALVALNPQKIIYVSCDPATFARDCGVLAQKGWQLGEAVPLDMFPQTAHVEVVGVLRLSA